MVAQDILKVLEKILGEKVYFSFALIFRHLPKTHARLASFTT